MHNRSALFESELDYKKYADESLSAIAVDINENAMSHTSCLRQVEAGGREDLSLIQFASGGLTKVSVVLDESEDPGLKVLQFKFEVAKGWHLTASQADARSFCPLSLDVNSHEQAWQVLSLEYPDSEELINVPGDSGVPVYQNEFCVNARLRRIHSSSDRLCFSALLTVSLQLCNEQHCLLPEKIDFRI